MIEVTEKISVSTRDAREIEFWRVENLIPYKNNTKKHPKRQITQLANIIKEQGFKDPIWIDEKGVILAGHGRRLAAIEAGLATVPVIIYPNLTESQKRKIRISANAVARTEMDNGMLEIELTSLIEEGQELDNLGLTDEELNSITDSFAVHLDEDLLALEEDVIVDTVKVKEPPKKKEPKELEWTSEYQVTIVCNDESHQRETYNKLVGQGYSCRVLTL
jgi:ParB-like chromosome segregation protein Spo0J